MQWPLSPVLYRLGAFDWTVSGGNLSSPSLRPRLADVWRTLGRELKGSAQPLVGASSLPERLRLPSP